MITEPWSGERAVRDGTMAEPEDKIDFIMC